MTLVSEREDAAQPTVPVSLATIARNWLRLGCTGFGGPPAHLVMLRTLCVDQHQWMSSDEFEHAVATTNILPGPASTQLAIYCGWRLRRTLGALLAGVCFIVPGLLAIIALGAVLLSSGSPSWLAGAALGAGAVVPAVALRASLDLLVPSFRRTKDLFGARRRWAVWIALGVLGCLTLGAALVLVLLACGGLELLFELRRRRHAHGSSLMSAIPLLLATTASLPALVWTALKVGALSFGGGFAIIPLMQADAVGRYHWMSKASFLAAVALGQITPGPVVQTVAVVGYAAAGLSGAFLAAAIAFAPSFLFVIVGGPAFERLRTSPNAQAFLAGAGPAAIGAIAGTAALLAAGLSHLWQLPLAFAGAAWLLVLRRSPLSALLAAGVLGAGAGALGLAVGF